MMATVAAMLGILLLAGGGYYWWKGHAKPLTDKDVLVLADFTNTTNDPVFDGTLHAALAAQLEESPFLKVLDEGIEDDAVFSESS